MNVDDLLGSTELPEPAISTERALQRTVRRGRARRLRRMSMVGIATAVVAVGLVATALTVVDGDGGRRLSTGPQAGHAQGSGKWRQMPTSPLPPRDQGVAVWTGSEVVIAGGSSTAPCAGNADCFVELEPLADGAAFDPATDEWRTLPDAPVGFIGGFAAWTGEEVLILARRGGASDVLLAYDPEDDSWSRRADPPESGLQSLAWTGDAWIGAARHTEPGSHDWRYVPAEDRWEALPADPLGAANDRSLTWTGEELVLIASRYGQEGLPPNGLYEAAVFSPDEGWRELPPSEIANNGGTWTAIGQLIVNPRRGTVASDSGYPVGGMLDVGGGEWRALPEMAPEVRLGGRTGFSGRADRWVVDDDLLLDPVAGVWHAVEDRPLHAEPAVAAWTGTELVTWGGTVQGDGRVELVAEGYAYRPPSRPTADASGASSVDKHEPPDEMAAKEAPPWAVEPLSASDAPATVEAWSSEGSPRDACPALAPADLGAGAGAVARRSSRGGLGSWWVAYDLAGAPGEAIAQTPSPDAGVETFFVSAIVMPSGPTTGPFPNQIRWNDGSAAGYGIEGGGELPLPPGTPAPWLAYLTMPDSPCVFQVKTYLGEAHLKHLVASLRFVEGAP